MGEMTLSLRQQDEIDIRIGFLKEMFRVLDAAQTMTIGNLGTLLLEAEIKVNEIKAILDGKNIIGRDENSVFGMN